MKKIILLSLLMLSQVSFGQDSLKTEFDISTIEIDSLRTIKQNYEDKYLAELKVVNKPTDKETKSYEVSKKLLNIYLESSFDRYMRFKREREQYNRQERINKSRKQNKEKVFKPIIDIERYEI